MKQKRLPREILLVIYYSNEDGKYNNTYRISKHINHRCNHSRDIIEKKNENNNNNNKDKKIITIQIIETFKIELIVTKIITIMK